MITILTILTTIWLFRKGFKADKKAEEGKKLNCFETLVEGGVNIYDMYKRDAR